MKTDTATQYQVEQLIRRAAMIRARKLNSCPAKEWIPRLETLDVMIARFAVIMIERKPSLPLQATWLRLIREAAGHVCIAVMDSLKRTRRPHPAARWAL